MDTKTRNQQDNTSVNRMAIMQMLQKHWRHKFGKPTEAQFDYLADMSYEIAENIPSYVVIDSAETLTPQQIITKQQNILTSDKNKGRLIGLFFVVALILAAGFIL